jgi:mannose-6-phosphate isomerase-like protein (cupin superfamily)
MADYTAKQINEMEAGFGGGFVKVRAELGVTSFGVQVIRLPPSYPDYPEHDHSEDGQEEVYIALEGSGRIEIEGDSVELSKDTFVRVAPGTKRKVLPGPNGLTMLVIGGRPGEKYEISEASQLTGAAS